MRCEWLCQDELVVLKKLTSECCDCVDIEGHSNSTRSSTTRSTTRVAAARRWGSQSSGSPARTGEAVASGVGGQERSVTPGQVYRTGDSAIRPRELLRQTAVGRRVLLNNGEEAISKVLNSSGERGERHGALCVGADGDAGGELLEEGQRNCSDIERPLRLPYDESIVELLSNSTCSKVPRLKGHEMN